MRTNQACEYTRVVARTLHHRDEGLVSAHELRDTLNPQQPIRGAGCALRFGCLALSCYEPKGQRRIEVKREDVDVGDREFLAVPRVQIHSPTHEGAFGMEEPRNPQFEPCTFRQGRHLNHLTAHLAARLLT